MLVMPPAFDKRLDRFETNIDYISQRLDALIAGFDRLSPPSPVSGTTSIDSSSLVASTPSTYKPFSSRFEDCVTDVVDNTGEVIEVVTAAVSDTEFIANRRSLLKLEDGPMDIDTLAVSFVDSAFCRGNSISQSVSIPSSFLLHL